MQKWGIRFKKATKTQHNRMMGDIRGSCTWFEWLLICVSTASCWSVKHVYLVLCCIFHALFPVLREFKASHLQPSLSLQVAFKGNNAQFELCFSFPPRLPDQYLRSLPADTRDTSAVFGISKMYSLKLLHWPWMGDCFSGLLVLSINSK